MDLNSFITFVARSELLSDPSRLTQPDCRKFFGIIYALLQITPGLGFLEAIYNVAVPPMEEGMTYDCFR
jgi:hypothetical protein